MVKEGSGSFRFPKRGRTGIIYVSSDIVIDSTFPFKEGEPLRVKINGSKLIVEKAKA